MRTWKVPVKVGPFTTDSSTEDNTRGFNTRSTPLRLIQHPTGQSRRRQHPAAAPRANWASRGPAGPAVEAAAGCQGSHFLAIGAALTAVCAVCPTPRPRPPCPLRDTNPGATPQSHVHRAPGGGHMHTVSQDLNARPSPQAAGPHRVPARLGNNTRCTRSRGLKCQETRVSCTETEEHAQL